MSRQDFTFNDLIGKSTTSTVRTLTIPAWNPHKTTAVQMQVAMMSVFKDNLDGFTFGIERPMSARYTIAIEFKMFRSLHALLTILWKLREKMRITHAIKSTIQKCFSYTSEYLKNKILQILEKVNWANLGHIEAKL